MSLLEKMAYSIPVIVSDIPELTSIISDQVEGLHFKLDNTKDLKSKIEYAINNKNGMIRLGMNARKRVEEICSINDPIAFHDNFYLNL